MAERLPRYRPLGVRIPGVPSVNYAQTGQAQAAVYNTMADALTKMADFAFEKQKAETIREAQQFAFDNPITEEQLQIALTEGIKPEDINVDPDQVFGATVLATTGKMMRAELEGRYRTQVAMLQKAVESPDWDWRDEANGTAAITTTLAGLEDGYFDALRGVDANEAVALKATTSSLGSSVYTAALEKQNKMMILEKRTNAQTSLDAFPAAMRAKVSKFNDGDPASLDADLQVEINSMRSVLNATGDIEFAETAGATLFDEVSQAKVDVLSSFAVSSEFSASDTQRASKIRRGDFGRYSKLYNAMSPEEQARVRQAIREEQNARSTEDERKRNEEDRDYATGVVRIAQSLADPDISSSQIDMQITNMYEIAAETNQRVISVQTIRALEKDLSEGAESNFPGNLAFRQAIARGEVVQGNFEEKRIEYGVTAKDAVSMVSTVEAAARQRETDVLRYARRSARVFSELEISEEQAIDMELFIKKVDKEFAAQISDWVDSGEQGPKPRRDLIAKGLNVELAGSGFSEIIEDLITSANNTLSANGITGNFFGTNTTVQDIEELEFPNEDDPDRVRQLKRDLKSRLARLQEQLEKKREFLSD